MSKATFDPTRYNNSANVPFSSVLERNLSRRRFLSSSCGVVAASMFASAGLIGCGGGNGSSSPTDPLPESSSPVLNFESIDGAKLDAVVVPEGYQAQVLAPWGTPINDLAEDWKADGSNTSIDQANAIGMHHDGMRFFPIDGSSEEGLLCINHEYIDQNALHPNGPTLVDNQRTIVDEVRKEINAHGVSVVKIRNNNGRWEVVKNDPLNRRYTGTTEMDMSGPVSMSDNLVTNYSPDGRVARGTLNNCGNGFTPWGTYLTCEENWPGYFVNNGTRTEAQDRIGISGPQDDVDGTTRYGWDQLAGDASETDDEFTRFNVTPSAETADMDYRNEANGHGYIVEIDPYTNSRAVKRTALGRFRHEGCAHGKLTAGEPISFYSGHDSRFEYLYRFVSNALWDPADANPSDRLATGAKYMDDGTLYVARFDENGVGEWLPLTLDSVTADGAAILGDTFNSLEEIILNTAGAADLVGATPMDRPEWTAVDPITGTLYLTLTNNTQRTEETGVNAANPRLNNSFGHIIRWDESNTDTSFTWDIFVFGAPSDADENTNISGLTDLNQFASPDGLVFDERGIMWIQTDNGADEVTEETNDQMLLVVPSSLVDDNGEPAALSSDNQMELKRFFVGPNRCEVTGLAFTPDNKNFFANIQHPGNWPFSDNAAEVTPEGTTVRPRAATVIITKTDGGTVGA